MPEVVFAIFLHVVAFGHDRYVQPEETKYQRAFATKKSCNEAAQTLTRILKTSSYPMIQFKGAVCRPLPMEGAK